MLVVVLSVLIFSACACLKKQENDAIRFDLGTFFAKNWDSTEGRYEKAAIPNKEIAVEVASAIFEGMEKSKEAQEYVPQCVFYDEQDEVWIVSFWKEHTENTVGACCSIAIQKADGKILRIWFGE